MEKYREKRRVSAVQKSIKKISDKHQLTENRYAAADFLVHDGSDEAVAGLLHRFDFTYDNSIKDKSEKEYVAKLLINFGERAVPFVKEYINKAENIAWPLKILGQLIKKDDILAFLLSMLNDEDSTFNEDVLEKRLDLLNYLVEFKNTEIVKKVIVFLGDDEEEVRYRAIEVLGEQGDVIARDPLVEIMVNEEESMRIKMRILEIFIQNQWTVSGHKKQIEEMLPEGFYLTREGKIKVRGNATNLLRSDE